MKRYQRKTKKLEHNSWGLYFFFHYVYQIEFMRIVTVFGIKLAFRIVKPSLHASNIYSNIISQILDVFFIRSACYALTAN